MDISDKAFNTLNILRNATWLDGDAEIIAACRELVEYFDANQLITEV